MPISPDEVESHLADDSGRAQPVLAVERVSAGYGGPPIVRGLSLRVGQGEVVTVAGPNGAGKSTLVKAVLGQVRVSEGTVRLQGKQITNAAPEDLTRLGVGYVPQIRDVFPTMSVRENLEMGAYLLHKKQIAERVDEVIEVFPKLGELVRHKHAVGKMSGGERKMLAVARALMLRPQVLVLDEPTAGLAVKLATAFLREQIPRLVQRGTSVLLVEQRATDALHISNWGYVLVSGQVKVSASASEILARKDIGEIFLGQAATGAG